MIRGLKRQKGFVLNPSLINVFVSVRVAFRTKVIYFSLYVSGAVCLHLHIQMMT